MAIRDLLDQFAGAFAHAIGDIRQKVVEEGWFGRTVTPPLHTNDLGWTTHAEREAIGWHEPAREAVHEHERDQGLDR